MPTTEVKVTAAKMPPVKAQPSNEQPSNAQPSNAQPPTPLQSLGLGPLRTLERFADDVTRIVDDFGLGRGWGRVPTSGDLQTWTPRVDVTQHKNDVVVRVDLPGMGKDDVKVNVADDAVTIHGERHRAQEEARDGVFRSERNYGAFFRTVALPAGTMTDRAKASFKNGVLEIRMPAAQGAAGRPVDIAG